MGKDLNRKGFAHHKFFLLKIASHNDWGAVLCLRKSSSDYQIGGGKFGPHAAVDELFFEGQI